MQKHLQGSQWLSFTITLMLLVISVMSLIESRHIFANTPFPAITFFYIWLFVALVFSVVALKEFVVGWLITMFSVLVSARIAALHQLYILSIPLMIVAAILFFNFLVCCWQNLRNPSQYKHAISIAGWQLIFIRIYIGYDFIPHFTEKLFAGYTTYSADVKDFSGLGVIDPSFFVVLAGLCEFGAAIGIGMGLFLRPGAVGATLYLLIATLLGHHFLNGFIWANPGGGWEFATLWMVLIFSFAVTGYDEFSLNQRLGDHFKIPKLLRKIM